MTFTVQEIICSCSLLYEFFIAEFDKATFVIIDLVILELVIIIDLVLIKLVTSIQFATSKSRSCVKL